MAICDFCNTHIQTNESGGLICLECNEAQTNTRNRPASEHDIRALLLQDVLRATALCEQAAKEFDEVRTESSGLHQGEAMTGAARKLTIARNELLMAHNRFNICLGQEGGNSRGKPGPLVDAAACRD